MMWRLRTAFVAFVVVGMGPASVEAAILTVVQGSVLVSHGAGYEAVQGTTDLHIGDTVIGKMGSAAQISLGEGCTISLQPGTMFRVASASPCGANAANNSWTTQVTEAQQGTNYMPYYLLGAAGVGGIAAIVVASSGGGSGSGSNSCPTCPPGGTHSK
jgi:hypothetical protein